MTRKAETVAESPEVLFNESTRARTHGYLRGPQQDVLRAYLDHVDSENVALELPTGTGKTAVGLLIAEWRRRRSGERAAYLALTNQLAHQVMEEGTKLGISCADITGDKFHRSRSEEGRYLDGSAIGVTTYSNLFNINPVVQPSDIVVLDDAHGGEQHVASMWTVEVSRDEDPDLYAECLVAIRPLLTDLEFRKLTDPGEHTVQLCDFVGRNDCITNLTRALDDSQNDRVQFSWPLIRNDLATCVIMASERRIVVRPIIPATHTHEPFSSSGQRLLMSATLGDPGDLMREYGLLAVAPLRAEHPQWGHRYIFVPEMHATEDTSRRIVAGVWDALSPRRAVVLTPSSAVLERSFDELSSRMDHEPRRVSAAEIADSLDAFTQTDDGLLAVAGRYDGLDFPDDNCRLLIMDGAPSAISDLERHLRDFWKLGPLMRRRELTRLLQGLGRCTRSSTDYSIVFWLGQSLVNAAANPALLKAFPRDVAAEVRWGVDQSRLAARDPEALVKMAIELLADEEYRLQANESLKEYQRDASEEPGVVSEKTVAEEVRFARSLWDEDFGASYEIARAIADEAREPGYRAWWWYLASVAAGYQSDTAGEADCLKRAAACGVNSGWLRRVATRRGEGKPIPPDDCGNSDGIWNELDRLGWAGPKFRSHIEGMLGLVSQREHKQFHEGLERLGRCLGAEATRSNEQGAPDVVWSFEGAHFAFEAKTEKGSDGALSKKEVLQARGHIDWVKAKLADGGESTRIESIIISPTRDLDAAAKPHAGNVLWLHPDAVLTLANDAATLLQEVRQAFHGVDFGEAKDELCAKVKLSNLHLDGILEALLTTSLGDPE